MFKAKYFNARFLRARHFTGGAPTLIGEKEYFSASYFRARTFGSPFFSGIPVNPPEIELIVGSIALEIVPNTLRTGDPAVVLVYVYDQFGQKLPNKQVTFTSSNTNVLNTPTSGFSDTLGRLAKPVSVGVTGSTTLTASSGGYSAYIVVYVSSTPGGPTTTLTHGATIQVGSPGGGVGNVSHNLSFYRQSKRRWPTK